MIVGAQLVHKLSQKSVPHKSDVLVGGLVWQDVWKAPFEGALTLLWKIALANCLTPRELCVALFDKHLLSGNAAGMHGRTLLVPRWMDSAPSLSKLGRLVRHAGLDVTSPRWSHLLGSDAHIRYCKECLAQGYHSAYCQIEGLRACPVHGLPLLDICTVCGAPTPRYALTIASMAAPYCCATCGEPLAERLWSPVSHQPIPRRVRARGTYRHLYNWFSELEKLKLSWPQFESWQPGREGQLIESERRTDAFGVLLQITPLGLARTRQGLVGGNNSISTFPASLPATTFQLRTMHPPTDVGEKRDTYRSIRRHIRKLLIHAHRRCLRSGVNALRIDEVAEAIYPISPICPVVFAYYIWRYHFESNVALNPKLMANGRALSMRDEALYWPVELAVKSGAWATFVVMSFLAFEQVAREWHEQIEVVSDSNGKTNFSALMQRLSDFRVALSPRYMVWSARISYLHESPATSADIGKIVIVGPPGQLRETLLEKTCCHGLLRGRHSDGQPDGFS